MSRRSQAHRLASELERELIAAFSAIVNVGQARRQLYSAEFLSIIAESQTREVDFAIGDDAKRAAVFELHFSAPVGSGFHPRPFDDRHVQECLVETVSRAAIHLHAALDF